MWLIAVTFTVLLRILVAEDVSCRDDDGNAVEWFVGYKFPEGYSYAYITPKDDTWKLSTHSIDQSGMMKHTFDDMFRLNNTPSALYGMYNDEKPGLGAPDTYYWGHMKGAVAFDQSRGFWLIHSVPKLSEVMDRYQYPHTGRVYAQHMLCVTLSSSYMIPLIQQLAIARPLFQSYYIDSSLQKQYPEILHLLENKRTSEDTNSVTPFETVNGALKMRHFSKSSNYGKDLYLNFVQPNLGYGLEVETWRHGGSEPSVCNRDDPLVLNINSLTFKGLNVQFSSYLDHAKWATTIAPKSLNENDTMWICLGDINRQESQLRRGGGTMCIQNELIWRAFANSIDQVEKCATDCSGRNDRTCEDL